MLVFQRLVVGPLLWIICQVIPDPDDRTGLFLGGAVGSALSHGMTREEFVARASATYIYGTQLS